MNLAWELPWALGDGSPAGHKVLGEGLVGDTGTCTGQWGYWHHFLVLISISQGPSEAGLALPWFWQPWLTPFSS